MWVSKLQLAVFSQEVRSPLSLYLGLYIYRYIDACLCGTPTLPTSQTISSSNPDPDPNPPLLSDHLKRVRQR